MSREHEWPFADPTNTAVFAHRSVVKGDDWVHTVFHDADDGAWQFHAADPDASDVVVVGLGEMYERDPSIGQVAGLPLGHCAWRERKTSAWVFEAE